MLRRFLNCRRGNYVLMSAILVPVLLSSVGLAVDLTNLFGARAKLQNSLDSALLAASRLKDAQESRTKVFNAFLDANLANDPTILSYVGKLTVTKGANAIETRGTITADIKFYFAPQLFGYNKDLSVSATAYESTDTLEVAMVLDNTGSMGDAGMKALREAATSMTGILEESAKSGRTVKAALVPFVTAVNVNGQGFKWDWIDTKAQAPYHGANFEPKNPVQVYNHLDLFDKLKVTWKGCVEARPTPYNFSDAAPDKEGLLADLTKAATLFVPYFAPDNPGVAAKSPNLAANWNNSYLDDSFGKSDKAKRKDIKRYFAASTPKYIDEKGPRSTGPNYACPTPIEPLMTDFAKLKTAIGAMIHWEGSGTNVSEGLAWGMRVLSPGEPYDQGAPFDSPTTSKVVVLFTDGENNVFGASNEAYNTSDYGAYGFLDEGRMGTTNRGTALTNVNTWTQNICTQLKDKDVEIFTVLLGADTKANRDLYSKCASVPENYYPTKDIAQLKPIFQMIAKKVANLHLTQ